MEFQRIEPRGRSAMIVIPCLNEASYIGGLIEKLNKDALRFGMKIVVVDGGSSDGTKEIVSNMLEHNDRLILMHNRKRVQSAGINLAVATYGDRYDYIIRVDAHGHYPDGYCATLLDEIEKTGADSVVVAMATVGTGVFQKATAMAQNSKLGNGGAKHRVGASGHWTDHGHHAIMTVSAFQHIHGYDETFAHNEDAEFDCRLSAAGYRIWMTEKTHMVYFPRSAAWPLFCQYLGYGRGRAKNLAKHKMIPKIRQAIPLFVMPAVVMALFATIHWLAAVPAGLWFGVCLSYGLWLSLRERSLYGLLAALSAMIMHLAWSTGFWLQLTGISQVPVPDYEQ
ncbi:succinoglycan biosynthesis protein ExoA [Phyllobacterium ifriqiyense]|uniref:Succinoglycan biosynthesis protein ExoA n=1 Tax=Phyllobacterium ifriqiyense TaxID=314238 RepID=A0ABU0S3U5_9HYPH|nr:glycosyltransferase family 2 protein [Phyllobacterium ifriqiyense]MDQ0995399.1 succinoglycan biosynthesis protein ExoA [Phyllobacterium ifriqiyense]